MANVLNFLVKEKPNLSNLLENRLDNHNSSSGNINSNDSQYFFVYDNQNERMNADLNSGEENCHTISYENRQNIEEEQHEENSKLEKDNLKDLNISKIDEKNESDDDDKIEDFDFLHLNPDSPKDKNSIDEERDASNIQNLQIKENLSNITKEKKKSKKKNKSKKKDNKRKHLGDYRSRCRTAIMKSYMKLINELSKKHIYMPDYKQFSRNISKEKVKKELDLPMKDILSKYNTKNNFEELKVENEDIELFKLLNMKYREVIEKFYDSEEFKDFKEDKNNKTADEDFKNKYGYSLFENNAFIRYFEEKKQIKEITRFLGKKRN